MDYRYGRRELFNELGGDLADYGYTLTHSSEKYRFLTIYPIRKAAINPGDHFEVTA